MRILWLLALSFWLGAAAAKQKIAVLDFELNDVTAMPNTPAEIKRTAEFAPLLKDRLRSDGYAEVVDVDPAAQKTANHDFGFLFNNPEAAAELGRANGADWTLVAQHGKASFLFSYFGAYLVNVKTGKAVARYDIELKGTHRKVSEHAVKRLAEKMEGDIGR